MESETCSRDKTKPLYLREFQHTLLLNQNLNDESNEQTNYKIPKQEMEALKEECDQIKNAIKFSAETEDNSDDFFTPVESQHNQTKSPQPTKNNVDDMTFLKDYIENKRYKFPEDEMQNSSQSSDEDQPQMNISYPRNIQSSRAINSKRAAKRKKHLENKIEKKVNMLKIVKKQKYDKKLQILQKIQDDQKDNANDEECTNDEYDDSDSKQHLSKRQLKKIKRIQKSQNKKQTFKNHDNSQHLTDEYYQLDFEDVIDDDTPVRFNYKTCVPNSFGLTPEEILLCDEKELNRWCSMRKVLKIRDESEEKKLAKMYEGRAKNKNIISRVLPQLHKSVPAQTKSNTAPTTNTNTCVVNRNKLVKKFFNKANQNVINDVSTSRLLAYNLENDTKYKSKSNPSNSP